MESGAAPQWLLAVRGILDRMNTLDAAGQLDRTAARFFAVDKATLSDTSPWRESTNAMMESRRHGPRRSAAPMDIQLIAPAKKDAHHRP